jgi:hypothetical protein
VRYLIVIPLLTALWLAPVSPAAAQRAAPAACTDQIANGGFEDGSVGWTATSAGGYTVFSQALPRTGQWGAFLAGYDRADDRLAQDVALPVGQRLTLSFWWQVRTEESDHPWDTLDVEITPAGRAAVRLRRITDADASIDWQHAAFDLSAYAGQTVTLSFRAQTDLDRPTDFYLDDVSIEACPATAPVSIYLPLALH